MPKSLLFILLLVISANSVLAQNSNKPNIIIFFCDDLGFGDIGRTGAVDYDTPNLDALAAGGMQFTNFYAAEAVCSASRAALITGCYSNRVSIFNALGPNAKVGIADAEMTIAELVKQKGYHTAAFGKWHLGAQKQFLPLQHGFDEYTGIPYSADMWPVDYDGKPITDLNNWRGTYPPLPLIEGNETVKIIRSLEDQSTLTTLLTEKTVEFIRRNQKDPFLIYVPFTLPHVPLAVSDKFKGKSKQGLYGDVVMEIDWSVGEVMKALRQYKLEENTLVIFTSDNGPWINYGNHAGSTGGLREGKGTSFEGGQREPCIMSWKGTIPAGTVCNELSCTIDLLPTIATITAAPLPAHKIDGVNILPLMKATPGAHPRDTLLYYYGNNKLEAVRKGEWKLVLPHLGRSYEGFLPGNDGYPGPVTESRMYPLALYDLRRDPGERYDVQAQHPEIVAALQAIAEKAREDLGDAITGQQGSGVRDCGHVE